MQVSSMDPEQGHLPAAATTTTRSSRRRRRLLSSRLCAAVSPAARNHAVAALAELAGTFLFLLFAFGGTNAVNTAAAASSDGDGGGSGNVAADPAKLLVISLSFGVSLAVNAWAFFRVSGGMFNPAVTLGLMVVGAVPAVRGLIVIAAQLLGGIAAAAVTLALHGGGGGLRVSTALGAGASAGQGLFVEVLITAQLVLVVLMLAVEKHRATCVAPVGIGLALFVAELMSVPYTGGSANPARSLGPAVATASFPPEHWIYWAGPALGALLAAGLYALLRAAGYEAVSPGQDAAAAAPEKKQQTAGMMAVVDSSSSSSSAEDGPRRSATAGSDTQRLFREPTRATVSSGGGASSV